MNKGHGLLACVLLTLYHILIIGKADVPIDPMLGFASSNLTSLNRLHSLQPNQKLRKRLIYKNFNQTPASWLPFSLNFRILFPYLSRSAEPLCSRLSPIAVRRSALCHYLLFIVVRRNIQNIKIAKWRIEKSRLNIRRGLNIARTYRHFSGS